MTIQILPAEEFTGSVHDEFPDLVHATGAESYNYQFARRELFDAFVRTSWNYPGTLFSSDATRIAVDGNELLGLVISFLGEEFRRRQSMSAPVWEKLVTEGVTDHEEIAELIKRVKLASWLNPFLRRGVYYIHAISVHPSHRSKGVGQAMLRNTLEIARKEACTSLELDVFSDYPAVDFYLGNGMDILVESKAPVPFENGVPIELRMGVRL